jgi:hypothetical protein
MSSDLYDDHDCIQYFIPRRPQPTPHIQQYTFTPLTHTHIGLVRMGPALPATTRSGLIPGIGVKMLRTGNMMMHFEVFKYQMKIINIFF